LPAVTLLDSNGNFGATDLTGDFIGYNAFVGARVTFLFAGDTQPQHTLTDKDVDRGSFVFCVNLAKPQSMVTPRAAIDHFYTTNALERQTVRRVLACVRSIGSFCLKPVISTRIVM
jgi:hypothetical protein